MSPHVGATARAVVIEDSKILLCSVRGADWLFLPGGGLGFGEALTDALKREILEESTIGDILIKSVVGLVENKFTKGQTTHHGIEVIFEATRSALSPIRSREEHIEFSFHDLKNLPSLKVLPDSLKRSLIKWTEDKQFFWTSFQ